jgi:hypothetical protein
MALKNSIQAMPLISYDTSLLSGSFVLFTPAAGLTQPLSLVKFINNSSVAITISYNGSTDHDIVPAMSSSILNFQANNSPINHVSMLARGTLVYISGSAGTGDFYMVGYYQVGGA